MTEPRYVRRYRDPLGEQTVAQRLASRGVTDAGGLGVTAEQVKRAVEGARADIARDRESTADTAATRLMRHSATTGSTCAAWTSASTAPAWGRCSTATCCPTGSRWARFRTPSYRQRRSNGSATTRWTRESAREFGKQLAALAVEEPWTQDRNAWGKWSDNPAKVNLAYAEAVADTQERDFEALGSEGGRQTVELALRSGFPVHPEVEQWARDNAVDRPPAPPAPDAGSTSAELQELAATLRRMNNAGFVHNALVGKLPGPEWKLGYHQTDSRREGDDTVATYRNPDAGTAITMRSNGSDILDMQVVHQATDLALNPSRARPSTTPAR